MADSAAPIYGTKAEDDRYPVQDDERAERTEVLRAGRLSAEDELGQEVVDRVRDDESHDRGDRAHDERRSADDREQH